MNSSKKRSDTETLEWVSQSLKERYSWISSVSYPEYEDYQLDLRIETDYGVFPAEVKSSRKHSIMLFDEWNRYYSPENPSGILRYSCQEIPDDIKGKHVYMINADTLGGFGSCKFCKMMECESILIYLTRGGYLIWDPKALEDSFLGFITVECYHTEDFRNNKSLYKETKALFAFEGAKYIKTEVPDRLFN